MINSSFDEAAISVSGLVVRRGHSGVLHGISFSSPRGSVTGLLSPSDCRKTILIRTPMGVQHIAASSMALLGLPVGHPRLRRRVAYTSQVTSIYTDIPLLASTTYFAHLLGTGHDSTHRAVEEVQLGGLEHRRIDRLSGGQASRAFLACVLVGDPGVLIPNEPMMGLNPPTKQALWELFRDLTDRGTILLVSSHVMDEVTRCGSVLLMRSGRFSTHGPAAALQYRTEISTPGDAFITLIEETA